MELMKKIIIQKLCEIEEQMQRIKEEVARMGTLEGEVRYWIEEKGLTLTEDEEEALVAEVIQRWDMMADDQIEDILEEIRDE